MQSRNQRGQFRRKTKLALFTAFLVASAGIVWLFAPYYSHYLDSVLSTEVAAINEPVPVVAIAKAGTTMEAKIEELKNSILDRLAACESAGKKEEDGIAILDSNDVGSYGPFQFQRKTVMYYETKRSGKPINGRDALILALQGDKARELAEWIIFDTNAGVAKDWVNCARKLDLQKEVEIIKRLTS